MKKLIALLIILLVAFVVIERRRVFVRDPLASVTRDGDKLSGEQVYINFYNDVILENDNQPMHVVLVQEGQRLGGPTGLKCIHWLVCLTDADVATILPLQGNIQSMSSKSVQFQDQHSRQWVVTLH